MPVEDSSILGGMFYKIVKNYICLAQVMVVDILTIAVIEVDGTSEFSLNY